LCFHLQEWPFNNNRCILNEEEEEGEVSEPAELETSSVGEDKEKDYNIDI
jgi:hypothetical protein